MNRQITKISTRSSFVFQRGIRHFSTASKESTSFPWLGRFGKWTAGQAVLGAISSGAIVSGAISLYTWYCPSPYLKPKVDEQESRKHLLERKVKAVEDCLVNYQLRANPSTTGIPKIERSKHGKTILDASVEYIINIEGPPGTGKSTFISDLLNHEHAKGVPVAHLELRSIRFDDIPDKCSVSNYICYKFGLESAVDSGKVEMTIGESSKYFEATLRKMNAAGKPTPILVIDDVQELFQENSVDFASSLEFLKLLVQWHTAGLLKPVLICSQVSGMPIRTTSFRLPEISDGVLFEHLKSKANPIRLERDWKPWTDQEIKYMLHTYGASIKAINGLFSRSESPIEFIKADLELERNHVANITSARPECDTIINEVLKTGFIPGDSKSLDREAINVLVETNILAVIERKFMFHSRIVQRACEELYGKI